MDTYGHFYGCAARDPWSGVGRTARRWQGRVAGLGSESSPQRRRPVATTPGSKDRFLGTPDAGDPGSWGARRVLRPLESRFSGVKIGTHGRPVVGRSPACAGAFDHRFSDADFSGTHPAMTRMDWSRIADSPRVDASQFTGSLLSTTAKCGTLADELAHEAFNPGFPPRLDALRTCLKTREICGEVDGRRLCGSWFQLSHGAVRSLWISGATS